MAVSSEGALGMSEVATGDAPEAAEEEAAGVQHAGAKKGPRKP